MTKYAIAAESGDYFNCEEGWIFVNIDDVPLYVTQGDALRALQMRVANRGIAFASNLRLVRVDEVVHAGDTKEVKRTFPEPEANGTISTEYEAVTSCTSAGTCRFTFESVDALVSYLGGGVSSCCHVFGANAIDTIQLPPTTTRVASELK